MANYLPRESLGGLGGFFSTAKSSQKWVNCLSGGLSVWGRVKRSQPWARGSVAPPSLRKPSSSKGQKEAGGVPCARLQGRDAPSAPGAGCIYLLVTLNKHFAYRVMREGPHGAPGASEPELGRKFSVGCWRPCTDCLQRASRSIPAPWTGIPPLGGVIRGRQHGPGGSAEGDAAALIRLFRRLI